MVAQWALYASRALDGFAGLLEYAPPGLLAIALALAVIGLATRNLVLVAMMYQVWASLCRGVHACAYAPQALPVAQYGILLFCALFASMFMRANTTGLVLTLGLGLLGAHGQLPRLD